MSNKPEHEDLRVRRTRAALQAALLDLIAEQPFDDVTVRELTERAMVNRATFYRHYRDKEELAFSLVAESVDAYLARAAPLEPGGDAVDVNRTPDALINLFRHVHEHAALYRALLRARTAPWFQTTFRRTLAEAVAHRIAAAGEPPHDPLLPADVGVALMASAFVGAVSWWLEHPHGVSPEEMAQWFLAFAAHGYLRSMGYAIPVA